MTRLQPLWSQPGSYPATTDRQLIRAIWPNGGVRGLDPAVVPESMQIQLEAGSVVVPAASASMGSFLCVSDAPERVAIGTAPPSGQDRIDLVTVSVDPGAGAPPPADDPGWRPPSWTPQAQAGTPGPNPVQPAPAAGTVPICAIRVRGGSAVLNPADLTDLRSDASSQNPGSVAVGSYVIGGGWFWIVFTAFTNGTYLTASAGGLTATRSGLYRFDGRVAFDANAGSRFACLTVDGTQVSDAIFGGPTAGPYGLMLAVPRTLRLAAGQGVGMQALQDTGSGQTINEASLQGVWING